MTLPPRLPPLARPALPAAILAVAVGAWWLSAAAIREDDLGYLAWALQARADGLAWLRGPAWLSYWRPNNALVWWLSAQLGPDGGLVRAALVALWTGAVALLTGAAARRPRRWRWSGCWVPRSSSIC